MKKCIFVFSSGWVLIGNDIGDNKIADASIIRRWGTTKGLGEIAENGPTKDTVLDPLIGQITYAPEALIFKIDCK